MVLSSLFPWHAHPKWIEWSLKAPQCDHFVHCSTKDQNAVAYTKNEEAGRMEISTRISPSKYFEKFVDEAKYGRSRMEWLALWTKHISSVELKFATTREEIRHVYENGPDSCMGGPKDFFHQKTAPHPVEAYAHDLAVAYTLRKNGRISSRVVVWPEKKVFGRRYGCDANLLGDLLRAEGYTLGSFENARLLMIDAQPFTKKPFTFLCPYIDSPSIYISRDEEERVLRLHDKKQDGRITGNTQSGYLAFPLPFLSDFSGKMFYPGNDTAVKVYISQRKSQTWTQSEANEHAYLCHIKERLYSKKDCPLIPVMIGGMLRFVCSFAADKIKIVKCDFYRCNVFYKTTDTVVVGYEPDGSPIKERWSHEAIRLHCFVFKTCRYALWLKSRLPWASGCPINEEHHLHMSRLLALKEATFPCRVGMDNIYQYSRVAYHDARGEWVVPDPAVEKIEKPLAGGQGE